MSVPVRKLREIGKTSKLNLKVERLGVTCVTVPMDDVAGRRHMTGGRDGLVTLDFSEVRMEIDR